MKLIQGKKGDMEMWQIILIIIAIAGLFFFFVWYRSLDQSASGLLSKLFD